MIDYNITWDRADYMGGPFYYKMRSKDLSRSTSGMIPGYRKEVSEWMMLHNCGEWVHAYMVNFKNSAQVTMFLLRWA